MNKAPFSSFSIYPVLVFAAVFYSNIAKAQIPANCLEIESILVDACGSPEGENEMVRFQVGPAAIATSNLTVNWPSNPFLGISPVNATTTNIVNALNATIVSCGHLVQPAGGLLPAGKTVLLITSTDISLSANSFASLSDTLYVIFQNAGNTSGHFANYSTPSGTRTLTMGTIAPACSDAVSYDKVLLVNQTGGHGGSSAVNDGATVEYSWAGAATYINNGCRAPFISNTSNAGANTSMCASGTLSLNGAAGGNYTSVVWQGGAGGFSNPTSLTTTYTAAAGDAGTITLSLGVIGHCNDTVFSSISVSIVPAPVVAITPGSATTFCQGGSVTLTASGGTSYAWSTGAGGASISVNAGGTYTVTATNSCGTQTATQAVTVNPLPTATITPGSATTFCQGDSVTLTASGTGAYSWSTGATSTAITVYTAGTYTLTSGNGCGSQTATQAVTINPLPTAVITPAGSTAICAGSTVVLNGSGGSSYLWLPAGVSTSALNAATAGTYTLTATNACGSDTATSTVSIINAPAAVITPAGATTICAGDDVVLNASGGNTYVWSNGETGNSITAGSDGIYSVTASNSCGSNSTSIAVSVDSVTAFFTASPASGVYPLPVNFSNNSSASAITWSWDFADNTNSAAVSPGHTFQNPGTYVVTLTAANAGGCTDTYSVTIVVLENPSILQVPNVFTPNNDGDNDLFKVKSEGIIEFECGIYNRWGIKMADLSAANQGWDGRTSGGEPASDGTYYYVLKAKGAEGKEYSEKGFIQLIRK